MIHFFYIVNIARRSCISDLKKPLSHKLLTMYNFFFSTIQHSPSSYLKLQENYFDLIFSGKRTSLLQSYSHKEKSGMLTLVTNVDAQSQRKRSGEGSLGRMSGREAGGDGAKKAEIGLVKALTRYRPRTWRLRGTRVSAAVDARMAATAVCAEQLRTVSAACAALRWTVLVGRNDEELRLWSGRAIVTDCDVTRAMNGLAAADDERCVLYPCRGPCVYLSDRWRRRQNDAYPGHSIAGGHRTPRRRRPSDFPTLPFTGVHGYNRCVTLPHGCDATTPPDYHVRGCSKRRSTVASEPRSVRPVTPTRRYRTVGRCCGCGRDRYVTDGVYHAVWCWHRTPRGLEFRTKPFCRSTSVRFANFNRRCEYGDGWEEAV